MSDTLVVICILGIVVAMIFADQAISAVRRRRHRTAGQDAEPSWYCSRCRMPVPPENEWLGSRKPVCHPPRCTTCGGNSTVYDRAAFLRGQTR